VRWLLLHGLGATGAVWHGVAAALQADGHRVVAPDLPGHGAASALEAYTVPSMAAAIALSAADASPDVIVGHSLGGYLALELANPCYGLQPTGVAMFSTKLHFGAEERERMTALSLRPRRLFPTEADAAARYRQVAGLPTEAAPGGEWAERGVKSVDGGWTLATDPAVYALVPTPMERLLAEAGARVCAAAGTLDPMVTVDDLRGLLPHAVAWEGLGHNPHVEAPRQVYRWLLHEASGQVGSA
jgi:pimeloyl-ACP methyl ester carboxylesterase